jgi:oligopeptide/dipeptide ABC transporter ATP-binding protein
MTRLNERGERGGVSRFSPSRAPVLQVTNLTVSLVNGKGKAIRPVVQDLNLTIHPGEMVGLVGESGSGKSVTATAILGLLPPSLQVTAGEIKLFHTPLHALKEKERNRIRGKEMAYVFQHYQGSFTPFYTIGKQLVEAIRSHQSIRATEAKALACEWLERVQLPAKRVYESYPFQLSGGQLQRASLAAALMLEPALLIADEPTTALDVLTGRQILDLLAKLQQETNCAVLFISHDLSHVLARTVRMGVMYGGRLLEMGSTRSMRENPQHPYTQLLLQARPRLTAHMPKIYPVIPGEPGVIAAQGCPFALRCPMRMADCDRVPDSRSVGDGHEVACHLLRTEGEEADETALRG